MCRRRCRGSNTNICAIHITNYIMDTFCGKLMGIFSDKDAIEVLITEEQRVTLIGKDMETLINRAVNPQSPLCRYEDDLTVLYAVTKIPRNNSGVSLMGVSKAVDSSEESFEPLLKPMRKHSFLVSSSGELMFTSCYDLTVSRITLISCILNDEDRNNPMYMSTLGSMSEEKLAKLFYIMDSGTHVLPYLNLHEQPIQLGRASVERTMTGGWTANSNRMVCKVMLPDGELRWEYTVVIPV